eukprot:tig00000128_g7209.t1
MAPLSSPQLVLPSSPIFIALPADFVHDRVTSLLDGILGSVPGWSYGEIWMPCSESGDGLLFQRGIAHDDASVAVIEAMAAAADGIKIAAGQSLVGGAFSTRRVRWTQDIGRSPPDALLRSAAATDAGFMTALAFPVSVRGVRAGEAFESAHVIAVGLLFSRQRMPLEQATLERLSMLHLAPFPRTALSRAASTPSHCGMPSGCCTPASSGAGTPLSGRGTPIQRTPESSPLLSGLSGPPMSPLPPLLSRAASEPGAAAAGAARGRRQLHRGPRRAGAEVPSSRDDHGLARAASQLSLGARPHASAPPSSPVLPLSTRGKRRTALSPPAARRPHRQAGAGLSEEDSGAEPAEGSSPDSPASSSASAGSPDSCAAAAARDDGAVAAAALLLSL